MGLTHGNPLQEQYPTTKPQHGAACITITVGFFLHGWTNYVIQAGLDEISVPNFLKHCATSVKDLVVPANIKTIA